MFFNWAVPGLFVFYFRLLTQFTVTNEILNWYDGIENENKF